VAGRDDEKGFGVASAKIKKVARLSSRLLEIMEAHARTYPSDAGLSDVIASALEFLESVSEHYGFSSFTDLRPQAMGGTPAESFLNLLRMIHGWMGFVFHSTAYKTRALLVDYVEGLSDTQYVRVVLAARSLVEHAAALNASYSDLRREAAHLDASSLGTEAEVIGSTASLIAIVLWYAQASRFNWVAYVRGDAEAFLTEFDKVDKSIEQTNILTLVQKLPQVEKRAAEFSYKMLCDFVHPNAASHMLTADKVVRLPDGRMRYELAYKPKSEEAYSVVLHVTSIPVRHALLLLVDQLKGIRQIRENMEIWIRRCEMSG